MTIRKFVLTGVLCLTATTASAQSQNADSMQMGTPEQRAACRPDVRRHCHHVKPDEGAWGYLACLKVNRERLSKPCRTVLETNGQ
jgi:hypothetical protein